MGLAKLDKSTILHWMLSNMILNNTDLQSELWHKLSAHYNELIDKHHKALEKESLTAEQTASIRGAIKQLRNLMRPQNNETNNQ